MRSSRETSNESAKGATMRIGISLLAVAWLMLASGASSAQSTQEAQDAYIAGYARALLDRQFRWVSASVEVKAGRITIQVSELQGPDRESIEESLAAIEGVRHVEIVTGDAPAPGKPPVETTLPGSFETTPGGAGVEEVVTPDLPMPFPKRDLFDDLLADPRNPRFTLGLLEYQGHERLHSVAMTSFGETFGLIRGATPLDGLWQLGLQASVFGIFDLDSDSNDLLNNDYRVGVPLSYRRGSLSAQLRVYHQSSHLGDEYILRDSFTNSSRSNLSYEGVDFRTSWNCTEWIRAYGGARYILSQVDDGVDVGRWSVIYGTEVVSPWGLHGGKIRPLVAAHVEQWKFRDWEPDLSLRAGILIDNMRGVGDRAVVALAYYKGRDYNGQFLLEEDIKYLGLVLDVYF